MGVDIRQMGKLDEIDRQIVRHLLGDGRASIPTIATTVGVGRSTAYARVESLRARGVIAGFTARIDPEAAGLGVSALVLVNVRQPDWDTIRAEIRGLPGVEWIGLTTGPFDFVLLVRARDLSHLRDVLLERIQSLDGVRAAQTVILLDEEVCDEM